MKTILQHPRTAWWLACLLSTCPFLILIFTTQLAEQFVPTLKPPHSQEVIIRTNGTTDDIVTVVKSLKRTDLVVTATSRPRPRNPILVFLALLYFTISLTLCFAFGSAMVTSAEIKMRQILHTKTDLNFEND